jgi:catalase
MEMSKTGNKIAVVGGASRIGCAAMTVTAAAAILTASTLLAEPFEQTSPEALISALESVFGSHPGLRKNHAKGMCAMGSFVGLPEARSYSRSMLFSGATTPVVARFSIGGGDPNAPDAGKGPRGMALEFRLADGSKQHMTMINAPMFVAMVPKTFLDNLIALKPDPATGKPDPAALKEFAATHPDSAGMTKFYEEHNPPPSYANSAFFGIHTFKFIDKNDKTTLVKWRFTPEDGEKQLTNAELTSMPHDFLEQALIDRVKQGPVKWDMWVTVGEPGDPETDPTVLWPSDRKELKAGTLTFTSATPQEGAECKNINYDPLVMSDGIAPTDDPVLLFRSPSYALSFVKRLQGQ